MNLVDDLLEVCKLLVEYDEASPQFDEDLDEIITKAKAAIKKSEII